MARQGVLDRRPAGEGARVHHGLADGAPGGGVEDVELGGHRRGAGEDGGHHAGGRVVGGARQGRRREGPRVGAGVVHGDVDRVAGAEVGRDAVHGGGPLGGAHPVVGQDVLVGEQGGELHAVERAGQPGGAGGDAVAHVGARLPLVAGDVADLGHEVEEPAVVLGVPRHRHEVRVVRVRAAVVGLAGLAGPERPGGHPGGAGLQLPRVHLGPDAGHTPVGQPGEGVGADLVVVGHEVRRDGDVVGAEPGRAGGVVGRHLLVGEVGAVGVVEVEEVAGAEGVQGHARLAGVRQAREAGGVGGGDVVGEDAGPGDEAGGVGGGDPGHGVGHVVHAHGHKRRHAAHDERLAGGPDHAAPDQVVEAAQRSQDAVAHPVVARELDGVARPVGGRRQEGRAARGRGDADAGRGRDAGQGHGGRGGDRLVRGVERGDVMRHRGDGDIRARGRAAGPEAEDGVDEAVSRGRAGEEVVVEVDQAHAGVHRRGYGVLLGGVQQGAGGVEAALADDDHRVARQVGGHGVRGDVQLGARHAELVEVGLDVGRVVRGVGPRAVDEDQGVAALGRGGGDLGWRRGGQERGRAQDQGRRGREQAPDHPVPQGRGAPGPWLTDSR